MGFCDHERPDHRPISSRSLIWSNLLRRLMRVQGGVEASEGAIKVASPSFVSTTVAPDLPSGREPTRALTSGREAFVIHTRLNKTKKERTNSGLEQGFNVYPKVSCLFFFFKLETSFRVLSKLQGSFVRLTFPVVILLSTLPTVILFSTSDLSLLKSSLVMQGACVTKE